MLKGNSDFSVYFITARGECLTLKRERSSCFPITPEYVGGQFSDVPLKIKVVKFQTCILLEKLSNNNEFPRFLGLRLLVYLWLRMKY